MREQHSKSQALYNLAVDVAATNLLGELSTSIEKTIDTVEDVISFSYANALTDAGDQSHFLYRKSIIRFLRSLRNLREAVDPKKETVESIALYLSGQGIADFLTVHRSLLYNYIIFNTKAKKKKLRKIVSKMRSIEEFLLDLQDAEKTQDS